MSEQSAVECPHCGKSVPWTDASKWKPFCSERCRMIDLGDWLSEKNAIASEETTDQCDSES
ncbi:MAG TPA: DNA gyrase inhibitor YacG [Gammaproteobacteria bacterium]|nr:DNA gyrase inhibitor YacG [Gammaproteobacteria bacterium]